MDFDNYIKLQEGLNMVSNLEITPFKFLPSLNYVYFAFRPITCIPIHFSYLYFIIVLENWKKINVEPSLNIYKY